MNLKEKYEIAGSWYEKVILMEIYHLAMIQLSPQWTLKKTSEYFGCSIGLVCENLSLAKEMNRNNKILKQSNREMALKEMKKWNLKRR